MQLAVERNSAAVAETVFMFSGQGSQYFQMGKALFDHDATFRGWMQRLDDVARQASGRSVLETLYSEGRGKGEPFDQLLLTHPAIFMVEYALAQSLITAGLVPDVVLGASLGSFAAAAVAELVSADDALRAVLLQAEALERWSEPGGMIAVLGSPALYQEEFLRGCSELAAVNFESHFVVSAKQAALREIEAALRIRNVVYQRLPVSFPFHSRWIEGAKAPFEESMQSIRCTEGRLPLACSEQATVLFDLPANYFWNVVRQPIRFRETAAQLVRQGPRRFIDVGPAGTLATFLKYGMPANSASTVHAILTPYGVDRKNLAAVLAQAGH